MYGDDMPAGFGVDSRGWYRYLDNLPCLYSTGWQLNVLARNMLKFCLVDGALLFHTPLSCSAPFSRGAGQSWVARIQHKVSC